MLVAPVVDSTAGELIGVVQAINTRSGQPFSPLAEEGVVNLCETMAIAFKQRQKTSSVVRGRYDSLGGERRALGRGDGAGVALRET